MGREFDVVVVGARCAGLPLATLLARGGLSVALVEQATFPRDTLSTHTFQPAALAFLQRLGVLSAVRATGAPVVNHLDLRQGEFRARVPWPRLPGEAGGVLSVRRLLLDPILMEAARDAGAEVWMGAKVTALVRDRDRVTGVRVARNGPAQALEAGLVVGADGRNSTIAQLAGSRQYNLTANERFMYWSFFAGADPGAEPTVILHRWSGNFVVAIPADSGLYLALALPELSELPRFRRSLEESYVEYVCRCGPVAHALSGARRVGKIFGMLRWEGFFREATGPGWVLAGDAGHFKDPAPGQASKTRSGRSNPWHRRFSAQSAPRRPRWTRRSRAGRAGATRMQPSTTGSPLTSARLACHPRCCRRSHSGCTSAARWTRFWTCSTTTLPPPGC